MKTQNRLYDIRLTKQERDFLIFAGGNRARKILSRATEIDPALPENKEILTDKKINELFGEKPYILYYNFDASKWSSDKFMDLLRPNLAKDTLDIIAMKKTLEKQLNFIDVEIVAAVIMTALKYPGWGNLTESPALSANNKKSAVGALVCRDKKNGKIMPQPGKYIGIGQYIHDYDVPMYAVQAFARDASASIHDSKFARTLHDLHKRQR